MPLLSPLQVIQISDTHLFSDPHRELLGLSTADSLKTVLDSVCQLEPKPDLLLLTGDLSQDESAQSYRRLHDLITPLQIPTYWLPGNHDCPSLMTQILSTSLISTEKAFQINGWNLILLSSMLPGKVYGELSSESLVWLEQQLQQLPAQPTLLALHHPPCLIGSDWMDQIGLRNPDDLFAVIDRYPQVKLVTFGHIHQEFAAVRAGVQYLGCPSTCVQFKPLQTDFAIDDQRPGFRLLTLYPDGQFTTGVKRVNYQPLPDLAATGY
jgi:3',5'-cyclic-AMP phosphodiesterase